MKALLAAILCLLAALSGAANYTTQRWHTKIQVLADQTLTITEEFEVTFTIPQHGIIRRIPLKSESSKGTHYVDYSLATVEWKTPGMTAFETAGSDMYKVSTENSDWIVKIGRGDRTVSGPVAYRLTYNVFGAINTFDQSDPLGAHTELYFNAIPIGWATDIDHGDLEVVTPKPTSGNYQARILAGPKGSRWGLELSLTKPPVGDPKLIKATLQPGLLKAEITRTIPKGYGVTVVLAMPEGTLDKVAAQAPVADVPPTGEYVDQPFFTAREIKEWLVGGLYPFALLPILIIVAYALKPRPGPMVVQFEPPAGIEASASGLLLDSRVDQQDIVAGILQVALKGGFKIDAKQSDMSIEVIPKENVRGLTPFEQEVHNAVSVFGTTVTSQDLRGKFGTYWSHLSRQLKAGAVKHGWYGSSSPAKVWLTTLFVVGTLGFGFYGMTLSPCLAPMGIILSLVIGLVWLNKILVWSQAGMDARNKIMGLKEFITRAQEKELDYMSRVTPSQALFENLLPYAVAFGAIKQWSQAFAGIDMVQPTWYAGTGSGSDFNAVIFGNYFYDMNDSWGRSITTPDPVIHSSSGSSGDSGFGGGFSSSDSGGSWDSGGGFSGGGDSGGGSGGGGGDSW